MSVVSNVKLGILINAVFWTTIAVSSLIYNIVNGTGYFIVTFLFLIQAIVYIVGYRIFKKHCQLGFYSLFALTSVTALLSIVDEVGLADLLSLLVSLIMIVALFRDRHVLSNKKVLD